jgi:hypothetical protein
LNTMETYQEFVKGLHNILENNQSILDKVNATLEYNKESSFKILADDLNLVPLIEMAGGTSQATVEKILSLPHSKRLASYLNKYVTIGKVLSNLDDGDNHN